MKDSIIQQALRVAYDQTHDQTSISQEHKVRPPPESATTPGWFW